MKTRFVSMLMAGLLAGGVAWADDKGEEMASCAQYAEIAELVMQLRQMGGSLQSVLEIADPGTFSEALILGAWDRPRMATEAMQHRMVRDFTDEIYMACVRKFGRD